MCRLRAVGSQGRLRTVGSWGDPREAILLAVLSCSPTTDSVKKIVVIGPKRKPSFGWAVELRRFFASFALFFVNVMALYFCIVFCVVLFVIHKCKMAKFIRAKFIFIL